MKNVDKDNALLALINWRRVKLLVSVEFSMNKISIRRFELLLKYRRHYDRSLRGSLKGEQEKGRVVVEWVAVVHAHVA